jgi:hypothetical protein
VLRRTSCFLDDESQPAVLGGDLRSRQEGGARGQDGGFQHGVLGPVEAEEVAQPLRVDDLRLDAHPLLRRVDQPHAELVGAAGVAQHPAADVGRRGVRRRRLDRSEGGFGQEQHVVGDVEHAFAVGAEVAVGLGGGVGAEQEAGEVGPFDVRPHRGQVRPAVGVERGDESFEDERHERQPQRHRDTEKKRKKY